MDEIKVEKTKQSNPNAVGVTVVIAMTIVLLTCILACAGVAITYILQAY
jgi:hypothetical protein